MSLQIVFNVAAMGLELNLRDALRTLRSVHVIGLILVWGWVVGPALAWLITRLLPLMEAHAVGLLLISLAPTAPFFPLMVREARGDMSFASAFMLLTTLGTVLLLPLLAPLLIEGLTAGTWSLAKPLLMMVLLPLLIGGAIRVFAPNAAEKLFPVVKKIGMIFLVLALVLYGRDMLGAVGSFAPGAQVLFLVAITAISYKIHFGLEHQHGAWDVHAQYRRGGLSIYRHHEPAAGPVCYDRTRGPARGDRRPRGGAPVRPAGPDKLPDKLKEKA